jgi:acyl dehydratase
VYGVEGAVMGVNYGTNKVRFPSPVPVGSRLRVGAKLLAAEEVAGGVQMTLEATFEIEGAAKPSCVAELVFRTYFG